MHERYMVIPVKFDGTVVATQGSAEFVTTVPLTFKAGAIWCPGATGTVYVRSAATGQGTATLSSLIAAVGSVFVGTVATGATGYWGTAAAGLHIPKGGTIIVNGSAGAAAGVESQLCATLWFAIGE